MAAPRRQCMLAAAVLIHTVISAPPPQQHSLHHQRLRSRPAFNYSWDKLSVYAFPSGGNRNFTDAEVALYSKFTLVLFWGVDNQPDPSRGPHQYVSDQEAKSLAQAAKIKAVNPDVLLFPYITGFLAQNSFKAQEAFNQPEHAAWWLCDPVSGAPLDCCTATTQKPPFGPGQGSCCGWSQGFPGKLYDWRIPAVRSYWTNSVIAPYVDSPLIAGIFMDDTTDVATWCMEPPHGFICSGNWTFTKEEQLDFLNATLEHLDDALESMGSMGKTAIVSTKSTVRSQPLNTSAFDKVLLRHGGMHFMESFAGTEDDVQTSLAITRTGIPFMVHTAVINDHVYPFAQREYCLAAFLIIAGEYSYWGMGAGWGAGDFPWYPEFDRPLGKPLADATSFGNGRYFREFEHLNVTLDTTLKQGTIAWHGGLGPVPTPPSPPAPPTKWACATGVCSPNVFGTFTTADACRHACGTPSPPPPTIPVGPYTGLQQTIIHQNPPSYNETRSMRCANQTVDGCADEASKACDTTAGCLSFSVISLAFNNKVFAELGPFPLTLGQPSQWWSTWQKPQATPGAWFPLPPVPVPAPTRP
jgi:hypothetical protein